MHPSFSNGLEHHDHTVVANEARPFSAHGEQKQNGRSRKALRWAGLGLRPMGAISDA